MAGTEVDGTGLWVDGTRLPWDAIERVLLRTTSDGPFAEDVFWVFETRSGGVVLPGAATGGTLLATLQEHLPGLDNRAIIAAMGSTDDATFEVFDRLATRWDGPRLRSRLEALVASLGGRVVAGSTDRLLAAWAEPHRTYHSTSHLAHGLDVLERFGPAFGDTRTVELAWFFHDAVYDPTASDNEERSAGLLLEFGVESALPEKVAARAAALVRSTAHLSGASLDGRDADLLHDVDLSILGSGTTRFLDYERGVRAEYAHVNDGPFALGRGAFLSRWLASERLFRSAEFHAAFDAPARANLGAALATPTYRTFRWVRWWRRFFGRA